MTDKPKSVTARWCTIDAYPDEKVIALTMSGVTVAGGAFRLFVLPKWLTKRGRKYFGCAGTTRKPRILRFEKPEDVPAHHMGDVVDLKWEIEHDTDHADVVSTVTLNGEIVYQTRVPSASVLGGRRKPRAEGAERRS